MACRFTRLSRLDDLSLRTPKAAAPGNQQQQINEVIV